MVFASDYHSDPLEWASPDGGLRMWYSGSQHVCKIDEPWKKSFVRVSPDGAGGWAVERVPLATRQYIFLEIPSEQAMDKAMAFVAGVAPGELAPVVVAAYPVNIPNVPARLRAVAGDRTVIWEHPQAVAAEAMRQGLAAPGKDQARNLPALLSRCVSPERKAFGLVQDLLVAGSTEEVWPAWRAKMGV